MRILGHLILAEQQHRLIPDLIAEEEIAEQPDIGVGEVERLLQHNVTEIAQVRVQGVVLQFGAVEMGAGVLVHAELADDAFEVVQGEEVGVVAAGDDESGCGCCVRQLVVALEHQGRGEVGLLGVFHWAFYFCPGVAESFGSGLRELGSIDVSSTCNDNVLSNVVFLVKLFDLVSGNGIHVVPDTMGWLAQGMISEAGVVDALVSALFRVH